MPSQPAQSRTINGRELLAMVQVGEMSTDTRITNAAASLRSWLVFKMNFRTIEIPPELQEHQQQLEGYYRKKKGA